MDYILGGGVHEKKCTVLVGDPGCGKTTVAIQFMMNGVRSHEAGAYICIDKKPERVIENAASLNAHVHSYIDQGVLTFIELDIDDWEIQSPINALLDRIHRQLNACCNESRLTRLIIDSLLPHILHDCSNSDKQYFIREFLDIIQTYGATSLAILHDVSSHPSLWLNTNHVSDQLLFTQNTQSDYVTYWLTISKNNSHNISGNYRFTVDPSAGLVLKHRQ